MDLLVMEEEGEGGREGFRLDVKAEETDGEVDLVGVASCILVSVVEIV
jgi:hypothetical protein